MGSISGRLCVMRTNNDFIHSSISEHTWWIAATLKSDENSYWTDRKVHSHTHIHIYTNERGMKQKQSLLKWFVQLQKLDTEAQILNCFIDTLSVLKCDFLNCLLAPTLKKKNKKKTNVTRQMYLFLVWFKPYILV